MDVKFEDIRREIRRCKWKDR